MSEDDISLNNIWNQTVGDDPAPDPYANCGSCNQGCSNPGLDPAFADAKNLPLEFNARLTCDSNSPAPTASSIFDTYKAQMTARNKQYLKDKFYEDTQRAANNPPIINPNRPGGGGSSSKSSSGINVVDEGAENPTGGTVGVRVFMDDATWDPSKDYKKVKAESVVDPKKGISEALGIGAAVLRAVLNPTPDPVQNGENCEATPDPENTPTTPALPGDSNQGTTNPSRPSGEAVGGGGTSAGGAGSFSGFDGAGGNGIPSNGNSGDR